VNKVWDDGAESSKKADNVRLNRCEMADVVSLGQPNVGFIKKNLKSTVLITDITDEDDNATKDTNADKPI